jgi:hydrogenase maturation protease
MSDLRQELTAALHGRVCWVGLGNPEYGDDGFGVRMAESLAQAGLPNVINAGKSPDRHMAEITGKGFAHVVFLDTVDFGGASGSTIFVNAKEIVSRFPQVSTHKLSLGLLAKWVEASERSKAWLLGVQPKSIARGGQLTPAVETTLAALCELLVELRTPEETVIGAASGARK